MAKFLKKHPYMIIGCVASISTSTGVGLRNGVSAGLIFFGVTMAISTLWAWIISET